MTRYGSNGCKHSTDVFTPPFGARKEASPDPANRLRTPPPSSSYRPAVWCWVTTIYPLDRPSASSRPPTLEYRVLPVELDSTPSVQWKESLFWRALTPYERPRICVLACIRLHIISIKEKIRKSRVTYGISPCLRSRRKSLTSDGAPQKE